MPVLCVHGEFASRCSVGERSYCAGVEQQPGLGLAVVTRSQTRQGLPQGVAQPSLEDQPDEVETRGEELPSDLSSGAGSVTWRQGGRNPPINSHPMWMTAEWIRWRQRSACARRCPVILLGHGAQLRRQ